MRFEKIVLSILTLIVVGFLAFVIYALRQHATGIRVGEVYNRDFDAAHTTYIWVNKIMVPQYHPDTYTLWIESDGRTNYWFVTKELFDSTAIGDTYSQDCVCITRRADK